MWVQTLPLPPSKNMTLSNLLSSLNLSSPSAKGEKKGIPSAGCCKEELIQPAALHGVCTQECWSLTSHTPPNAKQGSGGTNRTQTVPEGCSQTHNRTTGPWAECHVDGSAGPQTHPKGQNKFPNLLSWVRSLPLPISFFFLKEISPES